MNKIKFLLIISLSLCVLLLTGCEKDKINAPFSVSLADNAKFLRYIEERGDVINNSLPPSVTAQEVFSYIRIYLIVDLRDSLSFQNGHIQGSLNISNDTLFHYLQLNYNKYSKVVLVSASGQSAAYYSSLCRLAGFNNVYYMNYGMASWNNVFSSVWLDRLDTNKDPVFEHTFNPKAGYSPLPDILLNSPGESINDLLNERIAALFKESFNEDYNSITSKTSLTFHYWTGSYRHLYTICAGPDVLYSTNPYTSNIVHPVGAILYRVFPDLSDFRSTSYLQTLPPDMSIAIYSGSGQESAYYIAYLRLLGYDARSILFGMNNINYSQLNKEAAITYFAFTTLDIMNYPFITGTK